MLALNPKPALKLRLVKLLKLDKPTLALIFQLQLQLLKDSEQSPAEPKTYACTEIDATTCTEKAPTLALILTTSLQLEPKPTAALKLDN